MTPDQRKTSLLVVAAISCGWIGWSGSILLLPLSAAFPFLWSRAAGRASAALISAGYFLAASRGLPQGVANFYQSDLWPGLLLWLVASSSFVLVHAAVWTRHEGRRLGIRSVAAMILMAVPPFGIVGWAHPVTAAGVLFPGLGWAGLAAMATGLTVMVTRYWPVAAVALAGCWLWSAAFWTPPEINRGWHGVDLYMGSKLGRDGSLTHHRDLVATVRQIEQAKGDVVVLPESALGLWTPTLESRWQRELQSGRHAVIAGAAVVTEAGYDNVLVHISGLSAEVVYRERMPVPGSMWQPWRRLVGESVGAQAHFFDNPVAAIGGKKVAPLICYEQLIVWPILQSMLHEPELILAVGNGWWTTGTKIVAIQRMSVEAWARLFDKPFVMSFNT